MSARAVTSAHNLWQKHYTNLKHLLQQSIAHKINVEKYKKSQCFSSSLRTKSMLKYWPRHAKRARTTWHVIWSNLHLKSSAKNGGRIRFSFKERFLRFQLLFPDFYHFHDVIWGIKWAKKLKTKNGQNMLSGLLYLSLIHIWRCRRS